MIPAGVRESLRWELVSLAVLLVVVGYVAWRDVCDRLTMRRWRRKWERDRRLV